ncbi:SID1 transmembrane family member 1-like isoform X3 [Lineus longissimus]|uniref:SID1 transmembrane family member 1-like isoform X3 n=1 Tax=Lineus longissimus TaxID=88925 RepID=UPI00315D5EE0
MSKLGDILLLLMLAVDLGGCADRSRVLSDPRKYGERGASSTNPVSLPQIAVNAKFDQVYNGTVLAGTEYIYTFPYDEIANKTTAVRIRVTSPHASPDFPVLFVVRQERSILSWQVPLFLENVYDYYTVSRTLCPVQKHSKLHTEKKTFYVDVSSSSNKPTDFSMNASLLDHNFQLTTNKELGFLVSPSEPKYFEYEFPPGINSVLIKVTSSDSLCTVVSVQDIHCPVFDLDRNVQFTGTYQTMTKTAALTVQKKDYKEGMFYVVFVVKPIDFECSLIEVIHPISGDLSPHNNRFVRSGGSSQAQHQRVKNITVVIEPSISTDQYYVAVFGAVAWFLLFYVASILVSLVYHICDRRRKGPEDVRDEEESAKMLGTPTPTDSDSSPDEFDIEKEIMPQGTGSAEAPILNTTNGDSSYGTTSPTGFTDFSDTVQYSRFDNFQVNRQEKEMGSVPNPTGANFERDSNGIPHRIPPREDDSSSVDEDDFDVLRDVDSDKEIIRTKTILYVSDLARKDRKHLSKKYKLYHWNLITIAIFYGLPVIQLVITYQKVLHVTGDEDICYYNFLCARPLGVLSAFNNVFSNVGYIMLGLLFLGLTWRRDLLHKKAVEMHDHYEQHYGIPQHFGLFYAMGIALVMEGILSGCYHVCPSYSNFQFDTSFMYMIAWLCMLKIYQIRHPDINASAHSAYLALSLVIFIAVIGVFIPGSTASWWVFGVYDTMAFWVIFFFVHILTTIGVSAKIYYMGRWKLDMGLVKRIYLMCKTDCPHCAPPIYMDRMILLIVVNLVNFSFAIYGLLTQPKDFSSYLLAIFIINLLLYCAFYIIMKLRSREKILLLPLIYIILASIVWGFALYFFLAKLTSWEVSPAQSRLGNQECMLLDFYDAHDIWHFLSAMALFISFMVVLTLDDDLIYTPREKIPVF